MSSTLDHPWGRIEVELLRQRLREMAQELGHLGDSPEKKLEALQLRAVDVAGRLMSLLLAVEDPPSEFAVARRCVRQPLRG